MYRTCFACIASAPLALVNFSFGINILVYSLTVSICLLYSICGWMCGCDTELLKNITLVLIH